jgi:hypothetical protein
MTELIHSRRSPFIHTSRYVGGRRKLGCLPREQQPIAANRFKALAAAAAAAKQQRVQQPIAANRFKALAAAAAAAGAGAGAAANRSQSLQSTSSSSRGSSSSSKAAAGAAANRSQSLQSTSSSSRGSSSSSRSGGSSQAQAQAGPLAAASQPFAAGECWLEGQWPSRALSSTGRNAAAAPRAARRRRWGWRMPQLHPPIH